VDQVHFSPTVNCIVGLNGMGKTNLLDAIYYLCMCKSHFSIPDRLLVQKKLDFFRLEGHFTKKEKLVTVVAKVQPKEKKKEIEINGVPHKKLADHIGLLPIVMITPFDTDLAFDGSEARRRFLNNSLSQIDPQYLQAVIHDKRTTFCSDFLPIFKQYYQIISNEQEQVDCRYRSQLEGTELDHLIKASREKDVLLQRTTVGTHKDDLVFTIEEQALKKFASQGQMKSYILALKLAQYEIVKTYKSSSPLLLLDDIFDKLDNNRVQQLLQLLFNKDFGQIFFTDTNEDRLLSLIQPFGVEAKQLIVRNGKVVDGG